MRKTAPYSLLACVSLCRENVSQSKQNRCKDEIIVNKEDKIITPLEMSSSWIKNREAKESEKTIKYGVNMRHFALNSRGSIQVMNK